MNESITVLKEIKEVLEVIRTEIRENNQLMKKILNEQVDNVEEYDQEQVEDILTLKGEIETSDKIGDVLEAELFEKLTGVYLKEEVERLRTNKSKKSSRRVSINLNNELKAFFENHIGNLDVQIERKKEGVLVFYVGDKPIAAVKLITDLGFCRSEDFFPVVQHIVNICNNYGVDKENIFFIISTMKNGIEKPYVEKLLHHSVSSNDDFLSNHTWVQQFIKEYISRVDELPNPMNQIFILASDLHPNILSGRLINEVNYRDKFKEELNEYPWYSNLSHVFTSLHQLIKVVETNG